MCVYDDDNNFIHNWQKTLLAPLSAKKSFILSLIGFTGEKKKSLKVSSWIPPPHKRFVFYLVFNRQSTEVMTRTIANLLSGN